MPINLETLLAETTGESSLSEELGDHEVFSPRESSSEGDLDSNDLSDNSDE